MNAFERSAMQKLASELFTDEERAVVARAIEGGQAGRQQSEQEKIAALQGVDIDPEIFKEALALDAETLAAVIGKVASEMDPEEADLIVKKAEYDVARYQTQQAEIHKVGMELGAAMFHGFNQEAARNINHAAEQEKVAGVLQNAPALARALGIR